MTKRFFRTLSVCLASVLSAAACSQAAPLYNVQFMNDNGVSGTVTTAAGVSGSSLADINASETFNEAFGFDGNTVQTLFTGEAIVIQQRNPSPGDIIGDLLNSGGGAFPTEFEEGYFQIDISADSGTLDLTDITLEALRATTSASQRGLEIWAVVDGAAFTQANATRVLDVDLIPGNRSSASHDDLSGDLSGALFQGITSASFRVYATNQGSGNVEVANITVNGAAIPEPATLGLLALGVCGAVFRRRV